MSGLPYDDESNDYDEFDEDDFGFTEEDCGRWINGRLSGSCTLAGTEDCDWECPIGLAHRSRRETGDGAS